MNFGRNNTAPTINQSKTKEIDCKAAAAPPSRAVQMNADFFSDQFEDADDAGFDGLSSSSLWEHRSFADRSPLASPKKTVARSFASIPTNLEGADGQTPGRNDVLFGRGRGVGDHAGNVRFRAYLSRHRLRYISALGADKAKVVWELARGWRMGQSPPGIFLAWRSWEHSASGEMEGSRWYEVSDKLVRNKLAQFLREGNANLLLMLRKEMPEATKKDCIPSLRAKFWPGNSSVEHWIAATKLAKNSLFLDLPSETDDCSKEVRIRSAEDLLAEMKEALKHSSLSLANSSALSELSVKCSASHDWSRTLDMMKQAGGRKQQPSRLLKRCNAQMQGKQCLLLSPSKKTRKDLIKKPFLGSHGGKEKEKKCQEHEQATVLMNKNIIGHCAPAGNGISSLHSVSTTANQVPLQSSPDYDAILAERWIMHMRGRCKWHQRKTPFPGAS
mmetsp:Transcript_44364/g.135209  ORF Transcript_44364/g.135209 Transcript_44364/m.135209 type:complete len:444 (-) Transcript_44364:103-1434(-)